jgi:TPR repeat protein
VGVCYHRGEGVTKNLSEAVKWLTQAAQQNWPESQYYLGCMSRDGDGVVKNAKEAFNWFQKAAVQGDVLAQADLGVLYRVGDGVEKDPVKAVEWLQKAAEQGDEYAQHNLGEMLLKGEGLTRDFTEAAKWLREAADNGVRDAQFLLGQMYARGEGVQKDAQEALRLLKPLAEKEQLRPERDNYFALCILNELAIALNEAGRRKEAMELLRSKSSFSAQAEDELRYEIACLECLDGNLDEATRLVTKHLKLHPEVKDHAKNDSDLAAIRSVLEKL